MANRAAKRYRAWGNGVVSERWRSVRSGAEWPHVKNWAEAWGGGS